MDDRILYKCESYLLLTPVMLDDSTKSHGHHAEDRLSASSSQDLYSTKDAMDKLLQELRMTDNERDFLRQLLD